MKIIHLTDPHLSPKGRELFGRDPRTAFDAAIRDINIHHADAEMVILTGDMTHRGDAASFDNLADALAPLAVPVKLVIGNHDDRGAFLARFSSQPVDREGFVQWAEDTPAGRFLFLDTLLEGTHAGHYCDARFAWLADQLAAAGDHPLFLVMHHPPFHIGIPPMDRICLLQKDRFREAVAPYGGQIRHLFFGHVHRPISGNWQGIPFSTVRGTNHQVWLDFQAPKTQGSFEPPGYGIVLVDEKTGDVVVHYHDFLDASPKFTLHESPWNDWSRNPTDS